MKYQNIKICIVGCGVSGLSCGIKLLKAGFSDVHIVAKNISPHTTSDVAAAIWRPYHIMPEELATVWSDESLDVFKKLICDRDSGVSWMQLTELYKHKRAKPKWMNAVEDIPSPFIPEKYHCTYSVAVPLIDTSIYMPYLINQFEKLGGSITQQYIHDLHELRDYSYIINCTGSGARQLVRDSHVHPIKGHIIRTTKPEKLNYGIVEYEDEMTYVYPRSNDCVVGSISEENQWELSYDEDVIKDLFARAVKLCPELQSAKILEHKVGVRPIRKEVGLYAEPLSLKTIVIHNYGHGGRGYTLSWGCAAEVVKIIKNIIP